MKVPRLHWLCASVALLIPAFGAAQAPPPQPAIQVSKRDLAVYAAILNSAELDGRSNRDLIADTTSTFACGVPTCNQLSFGGCNGLVAPGDSPSQRMAIVQRDLPGLQLSTIASFVANNQQCAGIPHEIPGNADYYLFSDPALPKGWSYTFLVYFSRVGFNTAHTQALVNIGLFSHTDPNLSGGKYVLLNRRGDRWVPEGTSAVWELTPQHGP